MDKWLCYHDIMNSLNEIYTRVNADMDNINELEMKKDYDSILAVLKDQISFLEGYQTGETNQQVLDTLDSILRDRRIMMRVFKTAKQLDSLEKSTDDRISNLVHKITQIEKVLDLKKDGK